MTTGRYCTCCLLFHISKIQLQIGFAHINQVSSHKDSFINKILFYLLVKMMGTLKSVAEQQMIGKPTLKLLALKPEISLNFYEILKVNVKFHRKIYECCAK